jgi:hypothetical protein
MWDRLREQVVIFWQFWSNLSDWSSDEDDDDETGRSSETGFQS